MQSALSIAVTIAHHNQMLTCYVNVLYLLDIVRWVFTCDHFFRNVIQKAVREIYSSFFSPFRRNTRVGSSIFFIVLVFRLGIVKVQVVFSRENTILPCAIGLSSRFRREHFSLLAICYYVIGYKETGFKLERIVIAMR